MIKANLGGYLFHVFEFKDGVPNWDHSVEVIESPGVDNADFRKLAKHSPIFEVFTEWNTLSESAAWTTFGNYTALVGQGPQRLVLNPAPTPIPADTKDFDGDNIRVKVIEVTAGGGDFAPIRRVGGIVGGVNANGFNTLLTATWRLKWVDITPAP